MRVGLNVLHLVPGETGGTELYARRLVPALLRARPDLQATLFAGREAAPSLRNEDWAREVNVVELPLNARSRVRRVLAEQALLPGALRRNQIDLLHNLFTTAPAIPGVPQLTTIHDLIYKRYPQTHTGLLAWGLTLLVPLAARSSRRVLVPSEATKDDLVRLLGVPPDRIDVTYEGPGLEIPADASSEEEIRHRLELGDAPIVLTVSAKRPHKNLERLFEAVGALRSDPAPVLVAPGYETVFEPELRRRAGAQVRFLGWVDDQTLDALYRAATCFVFPSLAEGFGLPVLEAMLRNTPVACSRIGPLEEVAGDAALYFDPTDVEDMNHAIERLLGDGDLRRRLADAGFTRAQRFTWDETAAATLASYDRALRS